MDETDRLQPLLSPVNPSAIRYIKLGSQGAFAQDCIDAGELGLAFQTIPHALCVARDWEGVRRAFLSDGKRPATATSHVNELKAFYELDADALWFTFAQGRLWWAFAEPGVGWRDELVEHLPRRRRVIGGWRSTDIFDRPLLASALSRRLTKVAGFQQTICKVDEEDYLLRKLNGEEEPIILEAEAVEARLQDIAIRLIRRLHEKDFELLVDLIFNASGWRRVSILGETERDIDLLVEQIATHERAFVQVKSSATPAVLDDYIQRFRCYGFVDRFVFACHSPTPALERRAADAPDDVALWFAEALAQKAVRAGLFCWLVERLR